LEQAFQPQTALKRDGEPLKDRNQKIIKTKVIKLNLQKMPLGSMSEPEKLDFPLYTKLFNFPVDSIKVLDLSENRLNCEFSLAA
jgi:hypothetical protein